jgi:hypothetical protein
VTFFVNFGLAYEQANVLLVEFCDFYQLEQSRIHILLTELQSSQRNTASMFTEQELLVKSLTRRSNRLKRFGYSESMQIIGMTIKFIDTDEKLRDLLLLSKDFSEILRDEVLKQALLRSSQHRLKAKRKTLWLKLLRIDP